MNISDVHHNSREARSFIAKNITTETTVLGEIIDTASAEAVEFMFLANAAVAGIVTFILWESDDSGMSGATQVSLEEQLGGETIIASRLITRIGYIGKKRYCQARMISVGNPTVNVNNLIGMVLLFNMHHQPTAD